jgi:hypothetical protein
MAIDGERGHNFALLGQALPLQICPDLWGDGDTLKI